MNALTRATRSAVLPRVTAMAQRRTMSTSVSAHAEPSFKQTWLSDPATYPILVILGFAMGGCSAFMGWKITCHPDVRIMPGKTKGEIVRTWG